MEQIRIENVTKYYQTVPALQNINLLIPSKKIIGLIGESGSGKSTLARIIAGMEAVDEGELFFGDIPYSKQSKSKQARLRRSVQLVFQNSLFAVNPLFSVADVLLEPLLFTANEMTVTVKLALVKQMLVMVGLTHIDCNQSANRLSGGQLQRLCLARALIVQPDVLILDETLSGLDPIVQIQMMELLKKVQEKLQLTIIFISHSVYCCYLFCDEIVVLDQGTIVDVVKFDGDIAVLNAEQSVRLFKQDDPAIPVRLE